MNTKNINSYEDAQLVATTLQGLEEVLAEEIANLGAEVIEIGRRMVTFKGDKEMMYRANFSLRTAIRVLRPIAHFEATTPEEVYEHIKSMPWEKFMTNKQTLAVDAVVYSEVFRHGKFVAYKVKDAIVDYFRELDGSRPSVSVSNPDIRLNMHISGTDCTLSLDSSGESLHRRGYRQQALEAPLNEVLAAGILLLAGWKGQCDFIDPMCGSGTLPIEAALIACNIAPGVYRKEYGFERWLDFDPELLQEIYDDDSKERVFEHRIYARDINQAAFHLTQENARAAGVTRYMDIALEDFKESQGVDHPVLLITNPPYGDRLSPEDLPELYEKMGERLKHAFQGSEAWIIAHRTEFLDKIGLKADKKIPMLNGALPCELRKYTLFDGKYKSYKENNPTEESEEDFSRSIRKFKRNDKYSKSERRFSKSEGRSDRSERRFDRGEKNFDRSERKFNKSEGRFNRSEGRFDRGEKRFDRSERKFDRGERRFNNFRSKDTRRNGGNNE